MRTTPFVFLLVQVTARLHFSAPTFLPDRENAVPVNECGSHRDKVHPQHECAAHLLENHAPSWVSEMAWTCTSAFTSTSKTAAPPRDNSIYGWNHLAALSEHEITLTMRTTHFVFLLVQVGTVPSLNAKRTNNVCLLVFSCSQVLYTTVRDCVDIVGFLQKESGDVEANPVPMSEKQLEQFNDMHKMLVEVNARSLKIGQAQSGILASLNQVKQSRESIQSAITGINADCPRLKVKLLP